MNYIEFLIELGRSFLNLLTKIRLRYYFFIFLCLEETHLDRIFKNQITTLNIRTAENKTIIISSDIMNILCTSILTKFSNLICLKFHSYFDSYIDTIREPPTFFSSNLMESHINVEDFTDCLYLLDGRFKQFHTFYVNVHLFVPPSSMIINQVDYLN